MGEGVRLSSVEPIDEDGRQGCRAFYDFDTLIDIDFDRLLEDEEQRELLSNANPQTTAEVKALLEGVDGIKE